MSEYPHTKLANQVATLASAIAITEDVTEETMNDFRYFYEKLQREISRQRDLKRGWAKG